MLVTAVLLAEIGEMLRFGTGKPRSPIDVEDAEHPLLRELCKGRNEHSKCRTSRALGKLSHQDKHYEEIDES
ncbi:hypothetical protein [Bradyrhizobium sp. DOA1]|uniref:hypothetical protein n=1 Tax=Bradyrhizobium sp. DOA1 TaxID=1126616 RepID=UPI0012E8951C|nr:hypothetical protein [Bradyrhizobium sp. DOA1]